MIDWFVQTLRSYPEIAIFLSLALGYFFGSFTYKGLGLGAVTATLIAAVLIGQLGITVTGPLKPFFFLMFLFAIGYGVGPQFVRGIAKDGVPQAAFAAVVCVFCLLSAYGGARLAGYDVGSAVGLYAGSQTISASDHWLLASWRVHSSLRRCSHAFGRVPTLTGAVQSAASSSAYSPPPPGCCTFCR